MNIQIWKQLKIKAKQSILLVPFTFCTLTICGCTTQAWYDGVKEGAKNNCRNQPPSEVDRCLEKLNNMTYEEYEKVRSGQQ